MEDAHKNHRKRMYERFTKNGAASFFDHELMEMLLYFVIPRGDTNPTAHELLNEFDGISGVMKADMPSLLSVEGIGERSAMLLSIVGELFRRGMIMGDLPKSFTIKSPEDAVIYSRRLFMDKKYECFYVLCMDMKGRVTADGCLGEGTLDEVPVYTRKLVETALRHSAYSVVLVHNHPGGDSNPSADDDLLTQKCRVALESINISLHDHVIISDNKYFSYASAGMLRSNKVDELIIAAQQDRILKKPETEYNA